MRFHSPQAVAQSKRRITQPVSQEPDDASLNWISNYESVINLRPSASEQRGLNIAKVQRQEQQQQHLILSLHHIISVVSVLGIDRSLWRMESISSLTRVDDREQGRRRMNDGQDRGSEYWQRNNHRWYEMEEEVKEERRINEYNRPNWNCVKGN